MAESTEKQEKKMEAGLEATDPVEKTSSGAKKSSDAEEHKAVAALAYVVFVVPLLAAPNSPFAKYHANQGLLLFLYMVALNILGNLGGIGIFTTLGNLGFLVGMVMGIMNAVNGEMKPLPIIGKYQLIK